MPFVFWFVGSTDPDRYSKAKVAGWLNEIPTDHNPHLASVIHRTLQTGVEAVVVPARAWLAVEGALDRSLGAYDGEFQRVRYIVISIPYCTRKCRRSASAGSRPRPRASQP